MQQLRATGGGACDGASKTPTANGILADEDDNSATIQFNPLIGPKKSQYLDSLSSLNTLVSQDNIMFSVTKDRLIIILVL